MELPTTDYYGATDPEDAHRALRNTRLRSPLAHGICGLEVLSYELVRTVLHDRRFVMPAGNGLAALGIDSGPLWDRVSRSLVGTDGPAHHRLRRLVTPAFTRVGAQRMQGACVEIINDLLDGLPDVDANNGYCDVVADIARPYPVPVICSLLGVPRADWPRFRGWLRVIGKTFGLDVATHAQDIVAAWDELDAYLGHLLRQPHREPTLIAGLQRTDLTDQELRDLLALLLLAGTDTTRNQLAAAVQLFADHPDQWALLAAHPELAPAAVDEVMRYRPVSMSVIRMACADVELGGVAIAPGDYVTLNTASANRDVAAFVEPDRFDITRALSRPMLTFGGGAHRCLGAYLAKVELAEAFIVMSQRMPQLRLTGPAPWKPIVGISGPRTLPVAWAKCGTTTQPTKSVPLKRRCSHQCPTAP